MYRAIVERAQEGTVLLPDEEAHHLTRVRRAKAGTRFLGLTPDGLWLVCELDRAGRSWIGRIVGREGEDRESPLRVTLAQALIKKDKFEWVIQKSVELGVHDIVPLITKRTEVRPDDRGVARKLERWRKIVVEAVKQSGRNREPKLHEPMELAEFAARPPASTVFLLDEERGLSPREVLRGRPPDRTVTLVVGPEGGWDPEDRRILDRTSAVRLHLGPRILRTETAPVAMLAILQYEWGDVGGRVGPDLGGE